MKKKSETEQLIPNEKVHSKALWSTTEFKIYFGVIIFAALSMVHTTVSLSSEDHVNYNRYSYRLSQGWLGNKKIDNSDSQYSGFRQNVPALLICAIVFTISSHLLRSISERARILFSCVFSTIFFTVMFGASVIKIAAILSVNYLVTRMFPTSIVSRIFVWTFGLSILYLNRVYSGYKFSQLSESLGFLDDYKGMNVRWYVTFNFNILRMISFTMDYYWSFGADEKTRKPSQERSSLDYRQRSEQSLADRDYSFLNYYCYCTYLPLFLAGPVISFNDFIHQLKSSRPSDSITVKSTVLYGVRWLFSFLLMEIMMHYIHVVAISKSKAWTGFSPYEMSMVGYFNLKFIWLKLLVIWRFFRLWAMADGIETTENMQRCMSNNYSAMGFWRSWHRSYNRWLIRYLYVPLGGSKYFAYNVWIVFTFVAFWHDTSFTLLAWGWLISLFILPELICVKFFKRWTDRWYYRHLAAVGASMNVWMMMIANLVGFAVGLDGIQELLKGIVTLQGISFIICASIVLFCAVQLMFEIRESEGKNKSRF